MSDEDEKPKMALTKRTAILAVSAISVIYQVSQIAEFFMSLAMNYL